MKTLSHHYILESSPTDDTILYTMGKYRLSWLQKNQTDAIIKKYRINKNDPRPGTLRYMKDDTCGIMKDADEVIHRKSWDMNSLVGETEAQLMHKDYYKLASHIAKHHKKNHNVLSIFQCSSKKPYTENTFLKNNYFEPYKDYTDFACISNPGIIPVEFCGYYPYRYDEWNVMAEDKLHETISMTHKYRIVNMCRFIKYVKDLGYEHVIVEIANPKKQWIFDEMIKHDIVGCKKWLHVVNTKQFRESVKKISKYKTIAATGGIFNQRFPGFPVVRKKYETTLKQHIEDSLKKEFKTNVHESLEKPKYVMHDSLSPSEIYNKFYKSIEDNIKDPAIDKGDNDLYYKSYYWTALDILMIGLDGDLVSDIDKCYWDLVEYLKGSKKFGMFNDICFYHKELLNSDKVKLNTITEEAYKLGIVKDCCDFEFPYHIFK